MAAAARNLCSGKEVMTALLSCGTKVRITKEAVFAAVVEKEQWGVEIISLMTPRDPTIEISEVGMAQWARDD